VWLGQKIAWTCGQAKAKFVQADPGEVQLLPLLLLCQNYAITDWIFSVD
jgi:hypothetical protein